MWHAWERRGKCTRFWWETPIGKRQLVRPRHRWEDGMRVDLREICFDWFRIWNGGRLLWVR
jgi:hypothetical protein